MIKFIDQIQYLPVKEGSLVSTALAHNTAAENFVGDMHRLYFNCDTKGKEITITITGRAEDKNSWLMHIDGCTMGEWDMIHGSLNLEEDE